MILISNVRTSASKKINLMALIRTLTISTAMFERTKETFYGFWQTESFYKVMFSEQSPLLFSTWVGSKERRKDSMVFGRLKGPVRLRLHNRHHYFFNLGRVERAKERFYGFRQTERPCKVTIS